MRSRIESSERVVITKLNLVDLAGSERTKKTGSEG
jgi:kinesin family protein 6/9